MRKKLSEITRSEWIAIRWIEVSEMGEEEDYRYFLANGRRTPEEAVQAMMDWDATAEILEEVCPE